VLHVPPPPQILDRPGTIRWAVGSPVGPRSQTWSVVGHARNDDVFIGLRDRMGVMKLSLHGVKWRMAYTEQVAERHLPEGVDRVLTRWEHPPELAPGWRRGAAITIATSNLGPGYPEKKVKGGGGVAFFPAPSEGWAMRFDVLLGVPDHGGLTINDCVGDVGRMTMSSGAAVWIVASEFAVDAEYEAGLAELRRRMVESVPDPSKTRGWAWGWLHEDRAPALIDLSNPGNA
jgi:hypothetical protein